MTPIPWAFRTGPLVEPSGGGHMKDPCPVVLEDGTWRIFGTGFRGADGSWRASRARASSPKGPWEELDPARIEGPEGGCVGAPGVVAGDAGELHMFAQTDFAAVGSTIEHLVSTDGGDRFRRVGTALRSSWLRAAEAGVYDAHPATVAGQRWLAYAAFSTPGHPDLFVATAGPSGPSRSWDGPWKGRQRVLAHAEVACHHNAHSDPGYEWGLEGPQLVDLGRGRVLLNAVCFLPGGERGRRQRVFFALGPSPTGPFRSLGPVLDPALGGAWEAGENGHAAAIVHDGWVWLFYQARASEATPWRWGLAACPLAGIPDPRSTD